MPLPAPPATERHWLRRATLVWGLIALVETLHGIARALLLQPQVGELASRQWGVLSGSVLIVLIAWLSIGWIGAPNRRALLTVGMLWLALMLLFEVGVGRSSGASWQRIAADYLPWQGGLMPLGLLVLALAPWLAARLRGLPAATGGGPNSS